MAGLEEGAWGVQRRCGVSGGGCELAGKAQQAQGAPKLLARS
jgi:hypothetical protein